MERILSFSDTIQESFFYEDVKFFDEFLFDPKQLIDGRNVDINAQVPMTFNQDCSQQRLLTTFLYAAVTNNDQSLVDYLLQHNADVNIPVGKHKVCTPLHNAIKRRNLSIVKKLIAHGADLEQTIEPGQKTPLDEAVKTGDYNIVKALVDGGVEVRNVFRNWKYSQISLIEKENFHQIISLLWKNGGELWHYKSPMEFYSAMLSEAAWKTKPCIVEKLIKIDVDVIPEYVFCNGDKYPIVGLAISTRCVKTLQLLLSYHKFPGDSINRVFDCHRSLLHHMVNWVFLLVDDEEFETDERFNCDRCAAKHLLNAGINVDIRDSRDKLAIDYEDSKNARLVLDIKNHIVKLMVFGFQVSERSSRAVQGPEFDDLKRECQEEVQKMKNTRIGQSNLFYFRLFQMAEHRIAVFLKNSDLENFLSKNFPIRNDEIISELFPQYGGMIYYKLVKIPARIRLLKKTQGSLEEIFGRQIPRTFIDEIYGYLSYDDLKVLAKEKYGEEVVP